MTKKNPLYASSDSDFKKNTSKSIKEWTKLLDKWGAEKKGTQKTVEFLQEKQELPKKWAKAVCIRYQKEKYL